VVAVPRWVARPTNVGHATSTGIELEAKFRLDELVADWPKLNVRVNYSRYWSSVDGIPGPNNRLAQQPPWTANIGADYRMTSLPLSFGGNLNLTPSYIVTEAIGQEYSQRAQARRRCVCACGRSTGDAAAGLRQQPVRRPVCDVGARGLRHHRPGGAEQHEDLSVLLGAAGNEVLIVILNDVHSQLNATDVA
jgi:hypothetical protein